MKRYWVLFVFLMTGFVVFGQSADSLKTLIYAHFDKGEYADALGYLWESKEYYEKEYDLYNLSGCCNAMGYAYQRMGQFEEAIHAYQLSCQYMDELKEASGSPEMYEKNIRYTKNNMAGICLTMGDYDQAERMYLSCLESLGQPVDTMDYIDQSLYYANLADVYLGQSETMEGNPKNEKLDEAVNLAENALALSKNYNDHFSSTTMRMIMLASAYAATDRLDEAFQLAEEAMGVAEKVNEKMLQTEVEILYGNLYNRKEDYHEAVQHFEQAIALADSECFDDQKMSALHSAYLAAKHFDSGKALSYFEQWEELHSDIFTEQQQQLIHEYQVRFELNEKERELEIQERKNRQNRRLLIALSILAVLLFALLLIWIRMSRLKQHQNQTLKKMNGLKDNLLQVVSHDVKTSVFAQNLVLDQLYQHADSMSMPELKEHLFTLKTSSDALKYKLTNIVQWIVSELSDGESRPIHFNLLKLVQSCVAFHEAELKAKQLTVDIDIDSALECYDDSTVVDFVLQNLLTNAMKFSKPQGRIDIRVREEEQMVWLLVTDHGVGIAEEKVGLLMKDIVNPAPGTSGEMGTGLGLLVCQRLLNRNDSEIHIESKENEFTTVCFTIKK